MIKIFADTTSCLSKSEADRLGIPFFPQIIIFGNDSYRDDTQIDSPTFLRKLRESAVLPKTAAPPPALYNPYYQDISQNNGTALVICPSAQVSGTVRSAETAAQEFPGTDIRVIDTLSIGGGLYTMIMQSHHWIEEGKTADEIEAGIRDMVSRERIYFLVDTLEYLHKGGRIGTAKALIGTLLQVKPLLTFRGGHTEPVESLRTKRRAMARLREIIMNECPHGVQAGMTIMHGDVLEEATALAEELKAALEIPEIKIFDLPPAILTHAGPGTIAVSLFTSVPK
jgi:DegV family protein with EDD domain